MKFVSGTMGQNWHKYLPCSITHPPGQFCGIKRCGAMISFGSGAMINFGSGAIKKDVCNCHLFLNCYKTKKI